MLGLLTFRARVTRTNLWLALIAGFIGSIAIHAWLVSRLDFDAIGHLDFSSLATLSPPWLLALDVAYSLFLLLLVAARLHDMNCSAWWALVFAAAALIPPALTLIPGVDPPIVALAGLFSLLVSLAAWLLVLFWPATIGPNRYGPDPRGWQSAEHFERQRRELAGGG